MARKAGSRQGWRKVAAVVAVSALVMTSGASSSLRPGRPGQAAGEPPRWEESKSAEPVASESSDPLPEPHFPKPGAWSIELRSPGRAAAVIAGAAGPVDVVARGAEATRARLRLEVLDYRLARRLGASAFAFRLSGLDRSAAGSRRLPAELVIDYSAFATAFGGDFTDRLSVVAFPPCRSETAPPDGCKEPGTRLETVNNAARRQLIVKAGDLAALAATLRGSAASAGSGDAELTFGVLADASGETGSFAATDLSGTGQWQVAPGAGEFSYGYPIDVPKPGVGTAPSLGLGYSSGAVDGMTNGANTQASPVGVGWSLGTAFIERRYEPCSGTPGTVQTTDLCWSNQNGTINLEGVSGTLLPINGADDDYTEWVVHQDEGWRTQRLTGANNGAYRGEHWKVTGPDGTMYFFGLGQAAETGSVTNSALRVPVVSENAAQPCWEQQVHVCPNMGYRWMLDRVVDPDGNVTTYEYVKEQQRYALMAGFLGTPMYDRAALLEKIAYGLREGVPGDATARVLVGTQWRCDDLNEDCPQPDRTNAARFPDVPNDLICLSGEGCNWSPTFFTGKRYSHLRTQVRVGDTWRNVVQTNLSHGFRRDKLHLIAAGQVGLARGGFLVNPATEFAYTEVPNRVDINEELGRTPMYHRRLSEITSPFGGRTLVTYGQNRTCPKDYQPEFWDSNVRDCFPQTMEHGARHVGVFHKYLVTQVTEDPRAFGPATTTTYAYEEDPAWAFNYGAFAQYAHFWGWSNWRGYGTTRITQGSSTTRIRVFRGWDGDLMMGDAGGGDQWPGERRDVMVTAFDGSRTFVDHQALAGRVLEERRLGTVDGQSGQVASSTLYTYERRLTHEAPHRQLKDAEWAGVSSTTESVATGSGGFQRRGGTITYNARFQPVTSTELGWLDETGDERCTVTTYAEKPTANMFTYPAANRVVAGDDCATGEVLSASETYYDGSTVLGGLPGPGRPTRERMRIDAGNWAETVTTFDSFGRPVSVTDPAGATTTTGYVANPSHGIPTGSTVTNALGRATSTQWSPEFGVPLAETDSNGNVTTYAYDPLGRTWKIWRPGHSTAGWPTWIFAYFPAADRRAIAASQLTSPTNNGELAIEQSWAIYDGFWRERQTQVQSPASGRTVVSETGYDGRGLVLDQTAPQAVQATPGDGLITGIAWDNRTRTRYDDLERPTSVQWWRGTTVAHETTTAYGADTVTVTGPEGHRVRETMDGLGRTVEVGEHDGERWASTSNTYDLADNLTAVTSPEGNRVRYTYNLAGWQLTQTDPDRGTASFGYDIVGNQTSVTDGNGNSLHTKYDNLGRRTERRAGAPDGTPLASWTYDTAPGGFGLPASETTHTAAGDWVSRVTGYDNRGRPEGATRTVPASVTGLAGSYTVTSAYDGADRVVGTTYPAIAGLPAETVTTTYDNLGLARSMTGLDDYVSRVSYDDRNRPTEIGHGPVQSGLPTVTTSLAYNRDQQLAATETRLRQPDGNYQTASRHQISYDRAGMVTERTTSQNGRSWRECFDYDLRNRLTGAHTVDAASNCADGTPGTGDRPYRHSYQYSPDGNLLQRTEDGRTTAHRYPQPGGARPHAPTQAGNADYRWDDNGNLIERVTDGVSETFTWDDQNHLASVDGPDGTSSFIYDAAGQRLLRRTGTATTMYLFDHEITVNAAGDVRDAVRPYSFGGQLVATRSRTRGVEYYVSGGAGSLEAATGSGDTTVAGTRAYEPYGQVRAQDGEEFATDRGFLGQIEDADTGLSYLNARYYDPEAGLFLSPDPMAAPTSPYTYAAGNPVSFADPSGLSPTYTAGLEMANRSLRLQNKQLRGHISDLNSHISALQGVIRKQHRAITKLLTHIETLNGIIRQQQSVIRQLERRVNYLIGVVQRQQVLINQLRATVAYQQRVINAQAARIRALEGQVAYYKGIVNQLAGRLWGHNPVHLNTVLNSIHSGNGIPAGAFAHDYISELETEVATLRARNAGLEDLSESLLDALSGLGGAVTAVAITKNIQILQLQGTVDAYAESIRGHRFAIAQAEAWIRGEYEHHGEEIDFVFGGHYLSYDRLEAPPYFLVPNPPPWRRSNGGFWEDLFVFLARSACVANSQYQEEPETGLSC